MTRKDYRKIAQVLYENRDNSYEETVRAMAMMLKVDNPAFDAYHFYQACRVQNPAAHR